MGSYCGFRFCSFFCFSPKETRASQDQRVDFIENIHGHRIPDPYRWLEDQWSAETRKWLAEQKKYAELILGSLPSVEQVKRLLEPVYATEKMSVPSFVEGNYCYMKKPKGSERYTIFAREELDGEEKIVLDPKEISDDLTVTIEMRGVYAKGKYLSFHSARVQILFPENLHGPPEMEGCIVSLA